MPLTFCCGAECGVLSVGVNTAAPHWKAINTPANLSIVPAPAGRDGSAYKMVTTTSTVYLDRPGGSATVVVGRVALYFDVLPSATITLLSGPPAAGSECQIRYNQATGKLQARFNTLGTSVDGLDVLATGTWYVVDYRWTQGNGSANSKQIEWRVNGVDQPTLSGTEAASTFATIRSGVATACTATMYLTHLALSATSGDYPIADGPVRGLKPVADGTHNFSAAGDFKYQNTTNVGVGASDTWQSLDEGLSGITDFLAAAGAASGEYLEWQMGNLPGSGVGAIQGVEVVTGHHSASSTANKQSLRLHDGVSEGVVWADIDLSDTTLGIRSVHLTSAPSGAWDATKVNAARLRWGSSWATVDVSPVPFIDGAVLEVAYATPTVTTTPVAGTLPGTGALAATLRVVRTLAASVSGQGALAAGLTRLADSTLTLELREGGTLRATRTLTPDGTRQTFTLTGPEAASAANWANVQVSLVAGGGTRALRVRRLRLTLPAAPETTAVAGTLAGSGGLAATLRLVRPIAATVAGHGIVGANLTQRRAIAATLAGHGTLAGFPIVLRPLSATLAGHGALVGSPRVVRLLSASLSGIGALSGSPRVLRLLSATLTGHGSLVAAPRLVRLLAAALAGHGTLAGSPRVVRLVVAVLDGQGTLSGTVTTRRLLVASLAGQGTVGGTLTRISGGVTLLSATLAGQGTLVGLPRPLVALTATLPGSGSLSGALRRLVALSARVDGFGALAGELDAVAPVVALLSARLDGTGGLAGEMAAIVALLARLEGVGALGAEFHPALELIVVDAFTAEPRIVARFAPQPRVTADLDAAPRIMADWRATPRITADVTAEEGVPV